MNLKRKTSKSKSDVLVYQTKHVHVQHNLFEPRTNGLEGLYDGGFYAD